MSFLRSLFRVLDTPFRLAGKFDEWVITQADAMVLWLWNWFSMPKIIVLRGMFCAFLVSSLMRTYLKGDIGWGSFIWAALMLWVQTAEEIAAGRPAEVQNVRVLPVRCGGIFRGMRIGFIYCWIPISTMTLGHDMATSDTALLSYVVSWLASIYVVTSVTFTPTQPPQRKTKEVESTALEPDVA